MCTINLRSRLGISAVQIGRHAYPQHILTLSLTHAIDSSADLALVTFATAPPSVWSQATDLARTLPFKGESAKLYGAIDPRGRYILVGSDKGLLALYDPDTLHVLDILQVRPWRVLNLGCSVSHSLSLSLFVSYIWNALIHSEFSHTLGLRAFLIHSECSDLTFCLIHSIGVPMLLVLHWYLFTTRHIL